MYSFYESDFFYLSVLITEQGRDLNSVCGRYGRFVEIAIFSFFFLPWCPIYGNSFVYWIKMLLFGGVRLQRGLSHFHSIFRNFHFVEMYIGLTVSPIECVVNTISFFHLILIVLLCIIF